jgi:hypothetical protein
MADERESCGPNVSSGFVEFSWMMARFPARSFQQLTAPE